MSPLRWTCKSTRRLSDELTRSGHPVSARTVATLLHEDGYSLQANRKTTEGKQHPDRNAQFEHINAKAQDCVDRGVPVISVDTKKKELVGNFKNGGREWQPKGEPDLVDVHDFPSDAVGKAIPYGVYDLAANEGFVSVGVDHDTPVFAVRSIEAWWSRVGAKRYPGAREIFITADAPAPASGTRWSIACSRSSRSTGADALCGRTRPSSTSLATRPTEAVSSCASDSIVGATLPARRSQRRNCETLKVEREEFHGEWNYVIRSRMEQR